MSIATNRAILGLLLLVCVSCSPPARPQQLVKLPSGRTIAVLGFGPLKLGDGTVLLTMSYRTHRKITEIQPLRAEIAEVWELFRQDAIRLRYKAAAINAVEVPSGRAYLPFLNFETSQSKNFVFNQAVDGTWRCLCD